MYIPFSWLKRRCRPQFRRAPLQASEVQLQNSLHLWPTPWSTCLAFSLGTTICLLRRSNTLVSSPVGMVGTLHLWVASDSYLAPEWLDSHTRIHISRPGACRERVDGLRYLVVNQALSCISYCTGRASGNTPDGWKDTVMGLLALSALALRHCAFSVASWPVSPDPRSRFCISP